MHRIIILGFLFFLNIGSLFSQRKDRSKPSYFITTQISHYPPLAEYSFDFFAEVDYNDIELNFITQNSGTFVLEEGKYSYSRKDFYLFPNPALSLGLSFKCIKNDTYSEITISKISLINSKIHSAIVINSPRIEETLNLIEGFDYQSVAFGLRYEIGRYFKSKENRKTRFGLGFSLENSIYTHNRKQLQSYDYGIKAFVYNLELGLIPKLSFQISKLLSIDLKLVPNLLIFNYFNVKNDDLATVESKRNAKRNPEFESIEFNLGGGVSLRYMIKDGNPRKR